tara:strand:- start:417 stop:1241 length:825 start_codon:yes stop_codon:yes gene_type:complete
MLVLVTTYLGYYMGLRHVGSYMLEFHEWVIFSYLVIGTLLSAAGACTLNQAIEYKSDAKMNRTSSRPIPSGIISPLNGCIFGIILSILGVVLLYILIGPLVSFLSFLTIFTYIFIYTPMKKITYLNTLIGAIPGALPPIGGWFAATNETSTIVTALFGILFCWQIPHFLSLAYMYANDYKKGGFVMLPSLYSNQVQTRVHVVFFTLCLIFITFSLYYNNAVGNIYLFGNIILSLLFIYYVFKFTFTTNQKTAKGLFFASILYLPILLVLVIINS